MLYVYIILAVILSCLCLFTGFKNSQAKGRKDMNRAMTNVYGEGSFKEGVVSGSLELMWGGATIILGIIVLVLGFLIMGEFDKSPELESAAAAIESVESVTAPPTEQLASIPNQEQSMVTTQGSSDTSFDCRKAISRLENLICSDTNLASLDKALNDAYSSRIESASEIDKEMLRESQQEWVKTVLNECQIVTCAVDAYTARINEFR